MSRLYCPRLQVSALRAPLWIETELIYKNNNNKIMYKFLNKSRSTLDRTRAYIPADYKPAEPMSLYPTLDSFKDVLALARDTLPDADTNTLVALLATQHNTTLKVIQDSL